MSSVVVVDVMDVDGRAEHKLGVVGGTGGFVVVGAAEADSQSSYPVDNDFGMTDLSADEAHADSSAGRRMATAQIADAVDHAAGSMRTTAELADAGTTAGSTRTIAIQANAEIKSAGLIPLAKPEVTTKGTLEADTVSTVILKHDGAVHDPLGAGAYAFEKDFVSPQLDYLGLPTLHGLDDPETGRKLCRPTILYVHVSISVKHNLSPHAGIMTLIGYAFLHAKELKMHYSKPDISAKLNNELAEWTKQFKVQVQVELVESGGHHDTFIVDEVTYRRTRLTGEPTSDDFADLEQLVHQAAAYTGAGIQWEIIYPVKPGHPTFQGGEISQVIQTLLNNKERLGKELFPKTEMLAISHPCPIPGCGIAEIDGIKNIYVASKSNKGVYESMEFYCPEHGYHRVSLNNPDQLKTLQFGGPLHNLVEKLARGLETSNARAQAETAGNLIPVHLFVTGGEWAGLYNENLIWRQLMELNRSSPGRESLMEGIAPPVIAYVPVIQDWSGSRLSSSLISSNEYGYLEENGQGYILSFAEMQKQGKDVNNVFKAVEGWMKEPFKLFRPYSIEYVHRIMFGSEAQPVTANVDQVAEVEVEVDLEVEAINHDSSSEPEAQFRAIHDNKLLESPGRGAEFYGDGDEYISSQIKYLGLPTAKDLRDPRKKGVSESNATIRERGCGLRRGIQWAKQAILGPTDGAGASASCTTKDEILLLTTLVVHVGAQPNNSPHVGTLTVFVLAFLHAREIQTYYTNLLHTTTSTAAVTDPVKLRWLQSFKVIVQLDLVDTAPDKTRSKEHEGLEYQLSQRFTKKFHVLEPDYDEVMQKAAEFVGGNIEWRKEYQTKLTGMKNVPKIVEIMLEKKSTLGWEISPKSGDLGLRRACPKEGCGLAEKHGRKSRFERLEDGSYKLEFFCFKHGYHVVHTLNAEEVKSLEFNTPLRNLLRGLAYGLETTEKRAAVLQNIQAGVPFEQAGRVTVHLRVTGSDYTGSYSEQLFWRQLFILSSALQATGLGPLTTPVIAYAPLILDWAGSKISKSLYVKKGAYEYLKENGMGYFLSYADMKKEGKDVEVLFKMVEEWMMNPGALFRPYSVDYLHGRFLDAEASQPSEA